ncbi:hypothetical protein [Janthinobacterium fluminis]|uniref:Uncharacterized protein n=1 Tax=Janthinobacterium fluminis TaxID=2987524 RepID=A0ABT5K4K2_9BURK|nr:hypothetical protein [Janthinobacterium fluminis]MDC8759696.1 hypothetical protein [Janthinobacterium fluminis]
MKSAIKNLLWALFSWLALAAPAGAAQASWGEHGMALFGGKEGLYASHLPMFHAPHDYQVVLQFHLADAALDAALRRRLDGKTALWTIAPEKFELDRLAPRAPSPLTQFKADLVLGHFEQQGKTEYAGATLLIDKVLLFRRLSAAPRGKATASYRQIGGGRQRFLVKDIDSRPDFDHIVAFTTAANAPAGAVAVPKQALQQPGDKALAAALRAALGTPATIHGSVYFYTDDLK